MRIDARPCPLARSSVWLIDKERYIAALGVGRHDLDAIALDNLDSVFDSHDVANASRKSFGIPDLSPSVVLPDLAHLISLPERRSSLDLHPPL